MCTGIQAGLGWVHIPGSLSGEEQGPVGAGGVFEAIPLPTLSPILSEWGNHLLCDLTNDSFLDLKQLPCIGSVGPHVIFPDLAVPLDCLKLPTPPLEFGDGTDRALL